MYSIIDIESNGAPFRKECIIEIAIYKYDGHKIIDQFISLINPESEITPFVQKLTKISPKMVKTAPKFHEIAKRVVEITENTTLVGHNIDFDYRMLRQEFKRLGYEFKINTIDTIPLAKKLIPNAESYNLGKLVKFLGIPLVDQHRASGDAKATLELFKLLIIKDKDSEIIQQHHEETNAKTYLNKIRNLTQDLPSEKGIVYFQNQDGKIIYTNYFYDINKSTKSIFNSKSVRYKNIQKDVEQIHYSLVGTDILAKLIMKTKGLKNKESLIFGLFHKKDRYFVEKIKKEQTEKPFLLFKSYTQGIKAVNYINNNEDLNDLENFKNLINIGTNDELWLSEGRILGEKSFLLFEKGKLKAYGFYELYTQIASLKKLSGLKIDIDFPTLDLQNELKLGLLRGDFKKVPFPLV